MAILGTSVCSREVTEGLRGVSGGQGELFVEPRKHFRNGGVLMAGFRGVTNAFSGVWMVSVALLGFWGDF